MVNLLLLSSSTGSVSLGLYFRGGGGGEVSGGDDAGLAAENRKARRRDRAAVLQQGDACIVRDPAARGRDAGVARLQEMRHPLLVV